MRRGRLLTGLVAALSMGAVAAACSAGTGTEIRGEGDPAPVDTAAADAAAAPLLDLAVDLEQQLAQAYPGDDVAVAPLPVAASLSQARSGARATTAEELDRVLHTPDGDQGAERLATGLASLDAVLSSREGEQRDALGRTGRVAIDLAQSLWLPRGTTIEQPWLDGLAVTWGAGVRTSDFRSDPESGRKAINGWVADATDDHIEQVAPRGSVPATTRLLAAGAGYLKAPWVTPFSETETRMAAFHHLDGSSATATMMRNPGLPGARYGRGADWTAVDLPYLGRSLWMTVIVPDEGAFGSVEQGLDGDRLHQLLTELAPTTLDLTLPRFGFTTDVPLTEPLRALGLSEATDPLAADFGGITTEPLWLTSVLQQTYLAVAEQGTEATATDPKPPATSSTTRAPSATGAAPATSAPGSAAPSTSSTVPSRATPSAPGAVEVTVDRPFLVLVRDRPTGAVLFYGRVLSPNG